MKNISAFRFLRFPLCGNRIVATAAPRMAAADPFHRQPAAGQRAVRADRFLRILRTRRRETAAARRTEQQSLRGRKCQAIGAHRKNQDVLERIHNSVLDQARPPERGEKILFHPGEFFPGNRVARDQNQFHRLGQIVLMPAKTLAEQPPGAAALHRAADFFAGDHAQFGHGPGRQRMPVGNETAQHEAFAAQPDPHEIAVLRKPPVAAQTQAIRRRWIHRIGVRRLRPTRRRLARMALPLLLELRLRNPCWRRRRTFDG